MGRRAFRKTNESAHQFGNPNGDARIRDVLFPAPKDAESSLQGVNPTGHSM